MRRQLELRLGDSYRKMSQRRRRELSRRNRGRQPGRDFSIPRYRSELEEWLGEYCKRKGIKPKRFDRMSKQELYAIYFRIRKEEA